MTAVPDREVVATIADAIASSDIVEGFSVGAAVAAAYTAVEDLAERGWTVEDGRIPDVDEIHIEFADLDLTPKWLALGPRRYDVVPGGEVERLVAEAVASTLAYVASWQAEPDVADYRGRSDQIRALAGRWSESTCCPVCSEVVCDDDCPLYSVRDAAGVWVGSTGAARADEEDRLRGNRVFSPETVAQAQEAFDAGLAVEAALAAEDDDEVSFRCKFREAASGERCLLPEHDESTPHECPPPAEEVETINDHMVSASGYGENVRYRWLGSHGVSRETALRHAAWVVALADPLDERFPAILRAVRST